MCRVLVNGKCWSRHQWFAVLYYNCHHQLVSRCPTLCNLPTPNSLGTNPYIEQMRSANVFSFHICTYWHEFLLCISVLECIVFNLVYLGGTEHLRSTYSSFTRFGTLLLLICHLFVSTYGTTLNFVSELEL